MVNIFSPIFELLSCILTNFTATSSGVWLLSVPKASVGWYDILDKLTSVNIQSQDLIQLKNGLSPGKCLSIAQTEDFDQNIELNIVDCAEKQFAICRIEAPKTATPGKPPKFPCLETNSNGRKKRNLNNGKCQNKNK